MEYGSCISCYNLIIPQILFILTITIVLIKKKEHLMSNSNHTKRLAVFVLAIMCFIPVWANPQLPLPSPFFSDPASAAMGGTGVADPAGSIILNPARSVSGSTTLALPWASFTVSNPVPMLQRLSEQDWNSIAWSIPAGLVELTGCQGGTSFQMPYFAFDMRGGARLLATSYADEDGGALMSDLVVESGASLRLATGASFLFALRHRLDLGVSSGMDLSLWSDPVSAVKLSTKGLKDGVFAGTPLYTSCSVPLSFGVSYWYRGILGASLTLRNDSLFVFMQNTFADSETALETAAKDFGALFAGSAGLNLIQGWTGDLGFYLAGRFEKCRIKLLVDFMDIVGYIREPIYWPSQLHAGLELLVNGISLRVGYNRGITCGIGLDMEYAFLDASLTKILFPMPNESPSTYLSMKMRFGF